MASKKATPVTTGRASAKKAVAGSARVTKSKAPQTKKKAAPKPKPIFDDKQLQKEMKSDYKALRSAVKANWHDGYQEHCEMICDMANELNGWQGEVFREAIEPGHNLMEACTTMVILGSWINKLASNELNTRTDWEDFDGIDDCDVKDSNNEKIYEGKPDRIQKWMWRDLALKAIVQEDQKTLDAVMEHCVSFDLKSSKTFVGELIDHFNAVDDKAIPHKNKEWWPLQDEWYRDDEDMQEALIVFKEMLAVKE